MNTPSAAARKIAKQVAPKGRKYRHYRDAIARRISYFYTNANGQIDSVAPLYAVLDVQGRKH